RSGDFRLCDETDTLNRPPDAATIRYGSTPIWVKPSLWGGYSQYQYLHPNAVFHRVPDHVPAKLASLPLPLGNGVVWAYLPSSVNFGQNVRLEGPGQQGLACTVAAKEAGAGAVIVSGFAVDAPRLALARKLGATHTVNVDERALRDAVRDITGGDMADLVIDC